MNRVLEINEELGYAVVEPGTTWLAALRGDPGRRPQADALLHRPRLGQRDRQHARPRPHLHALRRRTSGCPAAWRWCSPTGSCCAPAWARCPATRAGTLQARPRPDARPAVHAVQLRDRDQDGRLAAARCPRRYMPLWVRVWNEEDLVALVDTLRGCAGRHDRGVPVHLQHAVWTPPGPTKRTRWYDGDGPIPDDGDRPDRPRARDRALDAAPGLFGDEAVVDHNFAKVKAAFEQIPGRRGLGHQVRGGRHPQTRAPSRAGRRRRSRLGGSTMTDWYGEEHGGHIGFSPVVPLTGAEACEGPSPAPRDDRERPGSITWRPAQ